MSIVRTEITLRNALDVGKEIEGSIQEPEVRTVTVNAIVDTGAWTLVINNEIREKLGLYIVGSEPGSLADGSEVKIDVAGPVEVIWKNRRTTCDALVLPDADDILLGAIPMEAMDLTINPRRELVGAHGDRIMHRVY